MEHAQTRAPQHARSRRASGARMDADARADPGPMSRQPSPARLRKTAPPQAEHPNAPRCSSRASPRLLVVLVQSPRARPRDIDTNAREAALRSRRSTACSRVLRAQSRPEARWSDPWRSSESGACWTRPPRRSRVSQRQRTSGRSPWAAPAPRCSRCARRSG